MYPHRSDIMVYILFKRHFISHSDTVTQSEQNIQQFNHLTITLTVEQLKVILWTWQLITSQLHDD